MLNAIMLAGLKLAAAAPKGVPGGENAGDKVFPPFDPTYFASQIFWLLISFFALYFILAQVLLPRIGETIEERNNRIADDLDTASRMQREAEDAEKAYERALADAKAKARNHAETTRQSIDAELSKELEKADEDALKQAEASDARIRKIRNDALANIDAIAAEAAQATVEALIGKKLSLAAVKKAVG
jgi:F-type H+-transporting ATPase subunit b